MSREEGKQMHVVMLAAPGVGTVNPMLQAALKLASMAVKVTFVNSDYNKTHMKIPFLAPSPPPPSSSSNPDQRSVTHGAAEISSSSCADPYTSSNLISFLYISDGLQAPTAHGDDDRPPDMMQIVTSLDASYGPAFENLLRSLVLQDPPVTCIVSTTLIRHVQDAAKRLHLPFFSFWPQSAASFASLLLLAKGRTPPKDALLSDAVASDLLAPGLPPLKYGDLSLVLRALEPDSFLFQFIVSPFKSISQADGAFINTFEELEPETVSFLRGEGHAVMTVGPLLPDSYFDAAGRPAAGERDDGVSWRTTANEAEQSSCPLRWLDEQEADSVIYVSFGSLQSMSAEDMEEIAMGLEASEQAFLWVVRPAAEGGDAKKGGAVADQLPEGFLQRATDRRQGMVIRWAPQLRVLRHAAVGGFLTHCGWNSTLEGMSAGVPLLCWPSVSDQGLNCRLAVAKWGVGMSFGGAGGEGGGGGGEGGGAAGRRPAILRGEIKERVVELMRGDAGKALRAKARDWRAKAIKTHIGSSHTNLQRFVDGFMVG